MIVAAAVLALTIATPRSTPPMIVNLTVAADVPAALVARITDEADAIWRGTGITFLWQRGVRPAISTARRATPSFGPPTLRVVLGHEQGVRRETGMALGWIVFEDDRPEQEIYVSFANAVRLLNESAGVVGHVDAMPLLMRETLLARALGRALAHEIGHYLLGSKSHSAHGLMMAVHTAAELFGSARQRFAIPPAEQQRMVARLASISIASRG
jgi:hypothetical protein